MAGRLWAIQLPISAGAQIRQTMNGGKDGTCWIIAILTRREVEAKEKKTQVQEVPGGMFLQILLPYPVPAI